MDTLLLQQVEIQNQINRTYINYKKTNKDRLTAIYIETKLEYLEALWSKFTDNHYGIIVAVTKPEREKLPYFTEDCYETLEEVYTNCKAKMKLDLSLSKSRHPTLTTNSSSNSSVAASNLKVKLPQIQLPTFAGNYEEWQSFHDMFVSLIHSNQNLSAVQKLHYLKSSLKGEPENLLRSLSTMEVNYEEAWNKLIRRYNNKRYNSNEILKRLFTQKPMVNESAFAIKQLIDTTSACQKSLKNLGIDIQSWDVMINYLIVSKLDYETRRLWETEVGRANSDEFPTYEQLVQFLEVRFRTLEMLCEAKRTKPISTVITKQVNIPKAYHSTVEEQRDNNENNKVCVLCSNAHLLYQCKQFASKSPEERSEFIQTKRLCFNCFSSSHNVKSCHQSTCCRRCGRRHHTPLHLERSQLQDSARVYTNKEQSSNTVDKPQNPNYKKKVLAHFVREEHQGKALLSTALVRVKSPNGYAQNARVLIDQGSETSFVTESTVQSLGLKRSSINGIVMGVGDSKLRTKNIVNFELQSLHNPEFSVSVDAFDLTSLTSFLPMSKSSILNWPAINKLPLADPRYGSPGKVDIILGVETYSQIILNGLLKHSLHDGLVMQNSQLGWIISGRVNRSDEISPRVLSLHLQLKEDYLLKQFWEIEREPDLIGRKLTKEESRCEEIYESTTTRNSKGRFVVRLPFQESDPKCLYGRSKEIAVKRLQLLERKLNKNTSLHLEYTKVLTDYLEQNHMD